MNSIGLFDNGYEKSEIAIPKNFWLAAGFFVVLAKKD